MQPLVDASLLLCNGLGELFVGVIVPQTVPAAGSEMPFRILTFVLVLLTANSAVRVVRECRQPIGVPHYVPVRFAIYAVIHSALVCAIMAYGIWHLIHQVGDVWFHRFIVLYAVNDAVDTWVGYRQRKRGDLWTMW
jgi:hypothetical protein